MAVIDAVVPLPDTCFGKKSGDVDFLALAFCVRIGQLGTPADTVRYFAQSTDDDDQPLKGDATYTVTVPAGLVQDKGYYSVTVYGTDNKLLIPNDKKIYDRTTYTSKQNKDGTYTLTLSPSGEGKNGPASTAGSRRCAARPRRSRSPRATARSGSRAAPRGA